MTVTHGETKGGVRSVEWKAWFNMLQRVRNPNNSHFKDYGARGISVCERWLRVENFISDMGRKPSPNHSLERMENDGNYEPGNCVWALMKDQARNTRRNRLVSFEGQKISLAEAIEKMGHPACGKFYRIVADRLRLGWDEQRALYEPPLSKPGAGRPREMAR